MTIEIVDLSIKNGGSFHSHVSLPEGNMDENWGYPYFSISSFIDYVPSYKAPLAAMAGK